METFSLKRLYSIVMDFEHGAMVIGTTIITIATNETDSGNWLKSLYEIYLRGWPQRQHESCIPISRGLLHGWQVWIWISGPAREKPWDKPRIKTHPRSTGSYPVRTRVRTCYLPFSVARGLVSPMLTTQPQSWWYIKPRSILTCRYSSSRDQLLAWATYCLVAVM